MNDQDQNPPKRVSTVSGDSPAAHAAGIGHVVDPCPNQATPFARPDRFVPLGIPPVVPLMLSEQTAQPFRQHRDHPQSLSCHGTQQFVLTVKGLGEVRIPPSAAANPAGRVAASSLAVRAGCPSGHHSDRETSYQLGRVLVGGMSLEFDPSSSACWANRATDSRAGDSPGPCHSLTATRHNSRRHPLPCCGDVDRTRYKAGGKR
jgi:hypothetical protein